MDFEKACQVADAIVFQKTQKYLTDAQRIILRGALARQTYEDIAEVSNYSMSYLKQSVGPSLWHLLSEAFGERVSKTNFQAAIERQMRSHTLTTPPAPNLVQTSMASPAGIAAAESRGARTPLTSDRRPDGASVTEPWGHHVDSASSISHQDWGDAPDATAFRGRTDSLSQLTQWVVRDRCRLLLLSGMGGIGKTLCAIRLGQAIQGEFRGVIWRSLKYVPPFTTLHNDLNGFFQNLAVAPSSAPPVGSPSAEPVGVSSPDSASEPEPLAISRAQIAGLMSHLQSHPWLIILDDGDALLQGGELAGQYRQDCAGYAEFFRRVAAEKHQSTVVLVGREQPSALMSQAGDRLPIRSLKLRGLEREDATQVLELYGLNPGARGARELIQLYRGNPSALRLAAGMIREVFDGNIPNFINQSTVMLGDPLLEVLDQQFERLSPLEQEVVYWLALTDQATALSQLQTQAQFHNASASQLFSALQSLQQRSLIDPVSTQPDTEGQFTLQPVVMKYATRRLIEQVSKDILKLDKAHSARALGLLKTHALIDPHLPPHCENRQQQQIVEPLLDCLDATDNLTQLGTQLTALCAKLETLPPQRIGHAVANLQHLITRIQEDLL